MPDEVEENRADPVEVMLPSGVTNKGSTRANHHDYMYVAQVRAQQSL
jgi:hypothetical protein